MQVIEWCLVIAKSICKIYYRFLNKNVFAKWMIVHIYVMFEKGICEHGFLCKKINFGGLIKL